jgi:NADPH:quinone reductase-like Zn-dependent oxidoreductase
VTGTYLSYLIPGDRYVPVTYLSPDVPEPEGQTMKAAIVTRFGSRWSIAVGDVPRPVPAAREILVRVRAATVSRTDCGELLHPLLQRLIVRGQPRRTILGMDFAGEVEAVGEGVSAFRPGERLFGMCPWSGNGAQADYVCLPETAPIGAIPPAVPFDHAPVFEGAYYASATVAAFALGPGHRILIYGASGAIGVAAVQLAKYAGAEVTAVVAGRHLDLARSLGADRVIDYATPEFRRLGKSFDFVLDAVGKMTPGQWRRLLKPEGRFAVTDLGPWGQDLPFLLWSAIARNGKASVPLPKRGSAQGFVDFLSERMAAGEFRAAVDRTYPLDEIADAYRYVQTGQKAGIVVIDIP